MRRCRNGKHGRVLKPIYNLLEERARELNRIQAVLEGANIKLASVVTDINGQSAIAILRAMANEETDAQRLSALAKGSLTSKIEELTRALKGSVGEHQQKMIAHQLRHIECLNNEIADIDEDIKKTESIEPQIALLNAMPGIGRRSAERILAEYGVHMEQFPSAQHLCSWAGLVPGCNESAGKRKPSRLRRGNVFLKTIMVECALAAIRNKNSFWFAKFSKIAPRRGGKKAVVSVARAMLVAIYHMLKDLQPFRDLGADYYFKLDAERIKNRHINALKRLDFDVVISSI